MSNLTTRIGWATIVEWERDSRGHIILNPIGNRTRYWSKGRRHLTAMLNAIERLGASGKHFTKSDLRAASGASLPAVCDLLSKLEDYEKIETLRSYERREGAKAACPAPARYLLKRGADLSRFREIADAYDCAKADA